jgi:hypothetical protein
MNIYIDETVHDQLGFMILAYVLCPSDPQADLERVLTSHVKDEFHSLEKMDGNEQAQKLRREIRSYVNWNCRWGVFVLPSEARWTLSEELPRFITELVRSCGNPDAVAIYMDEGIIKENALGAIRNATGVERLELGKSHETNGIQLADLVAALSGVRLREEISQMPKMLTFGDESGFNPPIEAELGYELWASLRYSMYRSFVPLGIEDMPEMAEFCTNGYGLFVSDKCSPQLRESAEKVFGRVYLGCIH